MCFVLYAGTDKPIPRRQWRKENPDVCVVSLTELEEPVRAHFSKPEIQQIGSTSGCGCDFPHRIKYSSSDAPCAEDEDANQAQSRRALVELLRQSGEKVVELYGVWHLDFAESPRIREPISLETILDPRFCFEEQAFYIVATDR